MYCSEFVARLNNKRPVLNKETVLILEFLEVV